MLNALALECVRGERTLFTGLNLALQSGTLLEVRGANGSGKTSLLRMLSGLLQPAAGSIAWKGNEICSSRESYCAEMIYIGHLDGLKPELSALENLRYAAVIGGLIGDPADALQTMGLQPQQHLPCKVLSQGQRRRVALARLKLSAARPLWILDEPFSALDAAAFDHLRETISTHLHGGGMVVLTTHQDAPISAPSVQRIELSS